ncbi:MAG: hypothetical protein EA401_02120 [Planctomycetota bacterium]|nr:MAG: hypothetical protein EA401_02120 [Planctomycetota bacterium]
MVCPRAQGNAKLAMEKEYPLRCMPYGAKSTRFRAFFLADREIGLPRGELCVDLPRGMWHTLRGEVSPAAMVCPQEALG